MAQSTFRHAIVVFGNPEWAQNCAQSVYESCEKLGFDYIDRITQFEDLSKMTKPENISGKMTIVLYFAGEVIPDQSGTLTWRLQNGDSAFLRREVWASVKSLVEHYDSQQVDVSLVGLWDVVRSSSPSYSGSFTVQGLGNTAQCLVGMMPCQVYLALACGDGSSQAFTHALLDYPLSHNKSCEIAYSMYAITSCLMFQNPEIHVISIDTTWEKITLN